MRWQSLGCKQQNANWSMLKIFLVSETNLKHQSEQEDKKEQVATLHWQFLLFAIPKRYENDETQRESTETQVLILCTTHFLSQENHTANAAVTRLHIPVQCLGVCKKDRFRSNLQRNSSIRVQGSELSTCRLLLLTSYCTNNVSTGGANSFPYTGKLKNPHKVAVLSWDSFAKLYVEIGPEDFVPTMYWNQEGKRSNRFRWFWTQWKIILLYKQNLETFALNSSVLK